MNRRNLIVAGVVVAVLFWLLFLHKRIERPVSNATSTPQPTATPAASPTGSLASNQAVPVNPVVQSRAEYDAKRAAQARSILASGNVPIKFWGLVIDQNDKPIADADITTTIRQGFELLPGVLNARTIKYHLKTNASGHFQMTNAKGDVFGIQSIVKPGYELSSKVEKVFAYSGSSSIFTPDPNKPVVFRMWKKSPPEKLVHVQSHANIPVDGTVQAFDLTSGERISGGQLRISLIRNPKDIQRGGPHYSWSASVEIADGGVIASDDEFMNQAPETGYLPQWVIEMKEEDPHWKDSVSKSLYFKTGDGKYGRLHVDLTTDFQPPPAALDFEVFLNPSGSRNLQYDVEALSH